MTGGRIKPIRSREEVLDPWPIPEFMPGYEPVQLPEPDLVYENAFLHALTSQIWSDIRRERADLERHEWRFALLVAWLSLLALVLYIVISPVLS